jgi:DNA-binding CsgD family transcriptional regulator
MLNIDMLKNIRDMENFSSILTAIDISLFLHLRINKQNKFFILSNNNLIKEKIINSNGRIGTMLASLATSSVCGKLSVALWQSYENDFLLEESNKLGIGNGISIALPFHEYIDIFSFASAIDNVKINSFYLNYFWLLKRVIVFYRIKNKRMIESTMHSPMFDLFEKVEFYNLAISEKSSSMKCIRNKILPREISIKTATSKKIKLSEKETAYLLLLLEGKSAYSIAKELNVSQRSVEHTLDKVKIKTGYASKVELLASFIENQIYQPSISNDRHYLY